MSFRTKLTLVLVGIIGIALLVLFIFYRQEFNVSKFSTYCGLLSFIPLLLFVQFTKAESRKFRLLGLFLLMMFIAIGWWAFFKAVHQIEMGYGWGYNIVWLLSLLIAVIGFVMLLAGAGPLEAVYGMLLGAVVGDGGRGGGGTGGGKGEDVIVVHKTDEDTYEIHAPRQRQIFQEPCSNCHGTGWWDERHGVTCSECHGSGIVYVEKD